MWPFFVVLALLIVALLARGAWLDHKARKAGMRIEVTGGWTTERKARFIPRDTPRGEETLDEDEIRRLTR